MKQFKGVLLPYLVFMMMIVISCDANNFMADKRQILAKDAVREKIGRVTNFDIEAFRQDTLKTFTDSNIIHPIQYTLDIVFKDSSNTVRQKKGIVLFTPSANQVISCTITDR